MELSFFGKMTAGFTHEVKNVLAIIKENAGLMEDILSMTQTGSPPRVDRLSRAIASIQEQADRGVELSNHLNRFAHSADHPRVRLNLNTLLDQLSLLAQRFARLKEVALQVAPCDQPVLVETCPISLQMALFTGLECCWNAMPPGGCVSLRVMRKGSEAAIGFFCQSSPDPAPELMEMISPSQEWAKLNDTVQILGGRMETGLAGHHFTIILPPNEQETP
jgi:C4-dicarboxylate-specific signal transduction histidine kinase